MLHWCSAELRERFPLHARLKTRIVYALTRHDAFFLVGDGARAGLCGFRRWSRFTIEAASGRSLEALTYGSRAQLGLTDDIRRVSLIRLLVAVFDWTGGPILLDDLVLTAGRVLGIVDFTLRPIVSHEHVPDPARSGEAVPRSRPARPLRHPDAVELAAYVDSIDGPVARVHVNEHLLHCEDCAADVTELVALKFDMQTVRIA